MSVIKIDAMVYIVLKNVVLIATSFLIVGNDITLASNKTSSVINEQNKDIKQHSSDVKFKETNKDSNDENTNLEIKNLKKQVDNLYRDIDKLSKNGLNIAPEDMVKVRELREKADQSLPTAKQALSMAKEDNKTIIKMAGVVNETKEAMAKVEASVNELQNKGVPLRSEDATRLDESLGKVNEVSGQVEKLEEKIKEFEEKLEKATTISDNTIKTDNSPTPATTLITKEDKERILTLSKAGATNEVNKLLASPALSEADKAVVSKIAQVGQQVAEGTVSAEDAEQVVNSAEISQHVDTLADNVISVDNTLVNNELPPVDLSIEPNQIENLEQSVDSDLAQQATSNVATEPLLNSNALENDLLTENNSQSSEDLLSDANSLSAQNIPDTATVSVTPDVDLLSEATVNEAQNDDLLLNNTNNAVLEQQSVNSNDLLTAGGDLIANPANTTVQNEDLLLGDNSLASGTLGDDLLKNDIVGVVTEQDTSTVASTKDGNDLSQSDLLTDGIGNSSTDVLALIDKSETSVNDISQNTSDDLLSSNEMQSDTNLLNDIGKEENVTSTRNVDILSDEDLLQSSDTANTLNVIDAQGNVNRVPVDKLKNKILSVAK